MDAATTFAINQKLAGLNQASLAQVATAALSECRDLECSQAVLTGALTRAGAMIPARVGEGSRIGIANLSATTTATLRAAGGPLWGRVLAGIPAVAGAAIGLASNNASAKAGAYAVLTGASCAVNALETFDLVSLLRSKLMAPAPKPAQPAAAQA